MEAKRITTGELLHQLVLHFNNYFTFYLFFILMDMKIIIFINNFVLIF